MTGYRHAVTLLLAHGLRGLPPDGSPALLGEVITRLARDLVALADDMRALPEEAGWTAQEFRSAVDRAAHLFSHRADGDLAHSIDNARTRGVEILSAVGAHRAPDTGRDLFLMYVPEDRIPIAAPLAVELTKRRFTVAFSDYEVDTLDQFHERSGRGLERHTAGLFLETRNIGRRGWKMPPSTDRFRIVRPGSPESSVDRICVWINDLKRSK